MHRSRTREDARADGSFVAEPAGVSGRCRCPLERRARARHPLRYRKLSSMFRAHPALRSANLTLQAMRCPSMPRSIAFAMLLVGSQSVWAGRECDAPPEAWQSGSAVRALAERNGWRVERLKIDDGCYEIKGRDAEGRRLKAKIDPASLKVISIKREHERRDRQGEREGRPPPTPGGDPG